MQQGQNFVSVWFWLHLYIDIVTHLRD